MKKVVPFLLACGIVGTANAESFLTKKPWEQSAIALQRELPAASCDGLFQAQRENAGMRYSFFTKYDKTWAEEVHISVIQKPSLSSEVKVQAYKVSGGLIFSTKKELPAEAKYWSAWAAGLLNGEPIDSFTADRLPLRGCLRP